MPPLFYTHTHTHTNAVLCNHKKKYCLTFTKMHWNWRPLYEAKQATLRNKNIANSLVCIIKFIIKRTWGRNSRQEPGSRSWSRDHGGRMLALHGLLRLLSDVPQDYMPRGGTTTVGWTIPHQSLIKKMSHGLSYSSDWWMRCFSPGFHFSGTSTSSCQTGKQTNKQKLTSTEDEYGQSLWYVI